MGDGAGVAEQVRHLLERCASVHRALTGPPGERPSEAVPAMAAVPAAPAEGPWRTGDAELLDACEGLLRLRSAVEATYLAAVGEIDRRRVSAADLPADRPGPDVGVAALVVGASTGRFLRVSAPLGPGQARADVAAARATAPGEVLHELGRRLADGEVTRAHVDVAVRCLDTVPTHLRRDPEDRRVLTDFFVDLAPEGTPRQLRTACRALLERLAPDRVHRFDPRAHERRFLDLADDATGMCVGSFALDAAAGAVLRRALDAYAAPRPTAPVPADEGPVDASGGDDPLTGGPVPARDERTPRQRRADALLDLAQVGLGTAGPSRGERPRVVVHTTAEQLADVPPPLALGDDVVPSPPTGRAATLTGQELDWYALRRLSCDAVVQRCVWDRAGNPLLPELLELGRTSRLVDVHLRRALEARDRGCVGCGAPAHVCDAHHVVHWADGGRTDLGNCCLLCGSCHTAVHLGHLEVTTTPTGHPLVRHLHARERNRRARAPHHHYVEQLLRRLRGDPGSRRGRDASWGAGPAAVATGPP
ncbi:HNH endonuclease signature motif containing protein [Aquipuribacter sp. SD81]|uniref:HNH endonuclease signature motif containing protein n=1 Tax=Aquipuribacter sp. SD81 TaxID=3127703 RepID=UPI0030196A5D